MVQERMLKRACLTDKSKVRTSGVKKGSIMENIIEKITKFPSKRYSQLQESNMTPIINNDTLMGNMFNFLFHFDALLSNNIACTEAIRV